MRTITIASALILLFSCTNEFQNGDLSKVYAINEDIALKYECEITVDIFEGEDKIIEFSINGIANYDDHLLGRVFVDYYRELHSIGLSYGKYVLKKENFIVYSISDDQMDLLIAKIEKEGALIDDFQHDKRGVYDAFDQSLKSSMSFDDFDTQMSELYLDEMKFCGFVYTDTLMSIAYENNQNRLMLISDPSSDKILGVQIR